MANETGYVYDEEIFFVSVPLRGKYRGEYRKAWNFRWFAVRVSVPLRGKYRGEFLVSIGVDIYYAVEFPSPCGVNIVANALNTTYYARDITTKFPSPCGVNIVANSQIHSWRTI